jgi:hypothetical protein
MHKYVWLFTLRHLYNIICSYQIRQFCFWKAQQFQWWWNSMYYQIKLFSSCQPKRVYSSKWIAVSWQVSYNSLSWCKNWLGPKVNITRAPQVFIFFLSHKKRFSSSFLLIGVIHHGVPCLLVYLFYLIEELLLPIFYITTISRPS